MIWEQQPPRHQRRLVPAAFLGTILIFIIGWAIIPHLQWTVERIRLPESIIKIIELQKRKKEEARRENLERIKQERHISRQQRDRRPLRSERMVQRQQDQRNLVEQRQVREELNQRRTQVTRILDDHREARSIQTNIGTRAKLEERSVGDPRIGRERNVVRESSAAHGERIVERSSTPIAAPVTRMPVVTPQKNLIDTRSLEAISPIIDWIADHQKPIPEILKKPELFDYASGDVHTMVEFETPDGKKYTMFLLGRKGRTPELKIFLRQDTEATLLQDIGAKGSSEQFKYGKVAGGDDIVLIDLKLLPAGHPKAAEMMSIFQGWWEMTQSSGG